MLLVRFPAADRTPAVGAVIAPLLLISFVCWSSGIHVHPAHENAPHPVHVNCPKVYIYELPSNVSFINIHSLNEDVILGREVETESLVRDTNQYLLTEIIYYRLYNSACRTKNPEDADLFFMPILAGMNIGPDGWPPLDDKAVAPPAREENALVLTQVERYDNQCKWLAERNPNLKSMLPHFNASTAHKHFMVMPNEHFTYKDCRGWFSHPEGDWAQAMRVSTTRLLPVELREDLAYMDCCSEEFFEEKAYPHLFSASYPSAIHWQNIIPYEYTTERKRLMLFIGDDSHGDVKVRQKITEQCKSYNDTSICESTKFSLEKLFLKRDSVFCLEPAGDSPSRRSIADSISFGCIPVFFSGATDYFYELNWIGWREISRILVPRNDYIAGDIDLKQLLSSMSKEDILQTQKALAKNGHKFQYSLKDGDDGVSSLLHGLKAAADITGSSMK